VNFGVLEPILTAAVRDPEILKIYTLQNIIDAASVRDGLLARNAPHLLIDEFFKMYDILSDFAEKVRNEDIPLAKLRERIERGVREELSEPPMVGRLIDADEVLGRIPSRDNRLAENRPQVLGVDQNGFSSKDLLDLIQRNTSIQRPPDRRIPALPEGLFEALKQLSTEVPQRQIVSMSVHKLWWREGVQIIVTDHQHHLSTHYYLGPDHEGKMVLTLAADGEVNRRQNQVRIIRQKGEFLESEQDSKDLRGRVDEKKKYRVQVGFSGAASSSTQAQTAAAKYLFEVLDRKLVQKNLQDKVSFNTGATTGTVSAALDGLEHVQDVVAFSDNSGLDWRIHPRARSILTVGRYDEVGAKSNLFGSMNEIVIGSAEEAMSRAISKHLQITILPGFSSDGLRRCF